MSKSGRKVRIFSALEVANICGVVNQTAINWIRNGHLKAFTTPGGQYRIYTKDLAAFLDKRRMGTSDEVLQVMMENANWDNLLIAADPSAVSGLKARMEALLPGFTIITAFDLFETGRKFMEEKPGYVLLDTALPGLDLQRLISTVRTDPIFGRPCVMLLADENFNSQELTEPNRPSHIFTKPLDTDKLAETIKRLEKQLEQAVTA